jgi:hypothetical protein
MTLVHPKITNHPDAVFTDAGQPKLADEVDMLAASLNVPITASTPEPKKLNAITQALVTLHDKLLVIRTELGKQAAAQKAEAVRLAQWEAQLKEREARADALDTLTGKLIAFEPKQETRSWWRR